MAATTRFTQICASSNDLFGLDDKGDVYQYNFNTRTWMKLATERRDDDRSSGPRGSSSAATSRSARYSRVAGTGDAP